MEKHKKHQDLIRRSYGNFGLNEVAFLGASCQVISDLAGILAKNLHKKYKLAYLDASHKEGLEVPAIADFTFHPSGNYAERSVQKMNPYNEKIRFSQYDFLFVNGSHYQAAQQVLILDRAKEASVLKRLDQLTNIQFLIKTEKDLEVFDFLVERYPGIKNLLCYSIDETEKIAAHIERIILQKIAPVQGLVLAGGKSTRMGQDKGLLNFHGLEQRNHLLKLLKSHNLPTFLSVRAEQNIQDADVVEDVFLGLGPFGAICSAFQKDPNKAWLVVATDLPFVDDAVIDLLLRNRNPKKIATALKGKDKNFPEPLITIWEPKAYPVLLQYLALGISCPRKVLINSDTEILEVDEKWITNVNTPEEYDLVKSKINPI
ncbi:MAG: NTP transferase domain-containing protein [Flavobacteriaceae bacterium]|nr:NTP transferase domain-containing protein [Flavobacteriaceae bacterium]